MRYAFFSLLPLIPCAGSLSLLFLFVCVPLAPHIPFDAPILPCPFLLSRHAKHPRPPSRRRRVSVCIPFFFVFSNIFRIYSLSTVPTFSFAPLSHCHTLLHSTHAAAAATNPIKCILNSTRIVYMKYSTRIKITMHT